MKVVTFNILCAGKDGGHTIAERAPRLNTLINRYSPDVLGFQEVRPTWEPFIAELSETYTILHKYRDNEKKEKKEGCSILWKKDKYELVDDGIFWYSKTPWVSSMGDDEAFHCKRICMYVVLKEIATDKQFAFFNTHLGFGDNYQIESVELLKQTVDIVGEKNTMIVGDFNFRPDTPAYNRAAAYFTDANVALGECSDTTYHGFGKTTGARIDFLFLNEGVTPKAYKLMDETFEGKFPSDHYGLCFDVELS